MRKFPDHEAGIRLLAARDPSGNLKYLDWGARMLASGQALAPEIADVIDLFHQFAGQRIGGGLARRGSPFKRIHPDLYTYRPEDLAALRGDLFKMKRARDRKRKKREQLYRIEGSIEAEIVYDSPDLVVRHIQNKQASVHYGLGTKWCISMLREGYFEDYEVQNATFFFFERKVPVGDEFDKVALMVPRSSDGAVVEAFTALDRRVDMISLARVYGPRVFDIFRSVYESSQKHPGSAVFHVYAGTATIEQVQAVFVSLKEKTARPETSPVQMREILEAICCNDSAPLPVLDEIAHTATTLVAGAWKRSRRRGIRRGAVQDLERAIGAALAIHPNVSHDVRAAIEKRLRRRHVKIDAIHRVTENGRVGVLYRTNDLQPPVRLVGIGRYRRTRYRRRRPLTVKALRAHAGVLERKAVRMRKSARRLQKKLTEKKLAQKKRTTKAKLVTWKSRTAKEKVR